MPEKKTKRPVGATEAKERLDKEIEIVRNFEVPSFYATRVETRLSKDDACLQFMEMLFVEGNKQTVRHTASVWVSMAHYKAIHEMMGRQLKRYEAQYGSVSTEDIGHEGS